MRGKVKALIAILILTIISGGNTPYVKVALMTLPPFTFTFVRFLLSFLIIFPIFINRAKPKFKRNDMRLIYLSLLSTANIFIFAFGIRMTMASIGQTIYSLTPILVALMSIFALKEKINLKKIMGIIIGFIGVNLVIFIPILLESKTINNNIEAITGNLLILIGCICYSYYTVLSKKLLKDYSPIWLTTSFIFTTTLVSLIFVPLEFSTLKPVLFYLNKTLMISVVYVIILGTVVAYLLQQYAIDRGTPLIASLMQYFFPISTIIWSFFILGEKINIYLGIGLCLILSGAWIVTKEA